MRKSNVFLVLILVGIALMGSACESSADTASYNLSRQAEEFRIARRISALNGFTNEPVFEAIGFCSVETSNSSAQGMLELTCKVGENDYTKDFVYLADNVNIVVEQLYGIDVPQYHKQFIFTPQKIIPMVEIVGGRIGG
jgi:hypothetical protein